MWTWMDEKSACGQTTYFARSIACVNRSGRRPLSLRERQLCVGTHRNSCAGKA
jgi:hypothetical protein